MSEKKLEDAVVNAVQLANFKKKKTCTAGVVTASLQDKLAYPLVSMLAILAGIFMYFRDGMELENAVCYFIFLAVAITFLLLAAKNFKFRIAYGDNEITIYQKENKTYQVSDIQHIRMVDKKHFELVFPDEAIVVSCCAVGAEAMISYLQENLND